MNDLEDQTSQPFCLQGKNDVGRFLFISIFVMSAMAPTEIALIAMSCVWYKRHL